MKYILPALNRGTERIMRAETSAVAEKRLFVVTFRELCVLAFPGRRQHPYSQKS